MKIKMSTTREYPIDMPEETIAYLEKEQGKQNQHVNLGKSRKNLRQTVSTMHAVLEKTQQRTLDLEHLETTSESLLDTSKDFYYATLPPWKRYILSWTPPSWWIPNWVWACFKCKKRSKRRVKRMEKP
jgi:hypothetical protein